MPHRRRKSKQSWSLYLAFVPAVILVAFIVYLVAVPPSPNITASQNNTPAQTPRPGETAKPFTLNLIDSTGLKNEKITFEPKSGKVVFIDFIHEWCVFCKNMAPVVEKLHRDYSGRGVVFITVAGGQNTNAEKTAAFIRNHGISWQVAFDPDLTTFRSYGVRGTPTYFIVDREGRITAKLEGEQSYQALANELEKLLRS